MLEFTVEDVFTIAGLGTVFLGKVESGTIAAGDAVVCRTRSADMPVRVIAVQDSSGHQIQKGEPGGMIGVVCKQFDLARLSDAFMGEGDNRKVAGVRLVTSPEKKRWWS